MRPAIILSIWFFLACAAAETAAQDATKAPESAAEKKTPAKRPAKPEKVKFAVDLRRARQEYMAKIRRGDVSIPSNSPIPMAARLRQVDTDAVMSWIRREPVGTIGRLPDFYIDILQVADDKNVLIGQESNPIWISGFATDKLEDGKSILMQSAVVKIGTKRYQTITGASKTIRSAEKHGDEPEKTEAGKKPAVSRKK